MHIPTPVLAVPLCLTLAMSTAQAADRVAHEDWAAEKRCEALKDLHTADARAALEALGSDIDDKFEGSYKRGFYATFADNCAAAPGETLTCIETAANSIHAYSSCSVNTELDRKMRFAPPLSGSDLVSWQVHGYEETSDAITAKVTASLVGTWTDPSSSRKPVITFAADGAVTYESLKNNERVKQTGTVEVMSPFRIQIMLDGRRAYKWAHFVDGDQALFSQQKATGAYPIAKKGATKLGYNGMFFLIEDLSGSPTCSGYDGRLNPMEMSCKWTGDGDSRELHIARAGAVSIESGSSGGSRTDKFVERAGHLIPASKSSKWDRVRQ